MDPGIPLTSYEEVLDIPGVNVGGVHIDKFKAEMYFSCDTDHPTRVPTVQTECTKPQSSKIVTFVGAARGTPSDVVRKLLSSCCLRDPCSGTLSLVLVPG